MVRTVNSSSGDSFTVSEDRSGDQVNDEYYHFIMAPGAEVIKDWPAPLYLRDSDDPEFEELIGFTFAEPPLSDGRVYIRFARLEVDTMPI